MIEQLLKQRDVPILLEKEEMLAILHEEIYGNMPLKPNRIRWEVQEDFIPWFCAGKASYSKVTLICELGEKEFSFPVSCVIPTKPGKHPFFVHINFRADVPDRYQPTEELVDNGFAVLSFCYNDITKDNADFTDGLAGILYKDGKRKNNDAGKLAMWAWATHRVMDYAQTLDVLDLTRGVVCGHSRLGKTALLAAATDERFAFVYANESGCSGASIARGTKGETVEQICSMFPYWFCKNYQKYKGKEDTMPFDQHFLIAVIAPRYVCVGSAQDDRFVEPLSELLSCVAASPAYEEQGVQGFIIDDRLPKSGDMFFDGTIGWHLRSGFHYFSREDWLKLIEFIRKKDE